MGKASAKIILFGEHAVVHGRLAIAAALDRGAQASARRSESGRSELSMPRWGRLARVDDAGDELGRAYGAILDAAEVRTPMRTEIEVEVPGGAGLGCSAAMGVAIARAVLEADGRTAETERVEACANAWERVFHGNPSGVDVAVATRGGLLSFRRGQAPTSLSCPVPIEIAIVSTGEPSSTKAMVDAVARHLERRPAVVQRTFDGIEQLADNAIGALAAGRLYEVGRLMDLNQVLLASLMVSTEALEKACEIARTAGALGAKLTGGGGGGCAIALCAGNGPAIVEAWARAGMEGFCTTITSAVVAR
jgi:mevalonate kinase